MARFQFDRAATERLLNRTAFGLVSRAMRGVENRAKQLVSVDTGETRASIQSGIHKTTRYTITGRVGSRLAKAHYVHEGTRAHIIRPRRKKALKFTTNGVTYIRAMVRHPGVGATPFLTTAMYEVCVPLGFKVERHLPARLRPREGTLSP